jgi:nitric oxide dioxygenase
VHKHVSVGITAEHYPIVGRHLLGAIQEVLGEAATPPLLDAWTEAYTELAAALIDAEKAMYAQADIAPGQLRDMRVFEVRDESEDIKSFVLEPLDGQAAPAFKPGQYVSVSVTFDNGATQLRQYSLSDAPNPRAMRISVKRERRGDEKPAGLVSNWLHDNAGKGTVVRVTHPFGDFIPDTESMFPIVLLSAGVGITPMISVLNRIVQANPTRRVIFGHATRDNTYHAHRADVAAAKKTMPNLQVVTFYEDHNDCDGVATIAGRMVFSKLPGWAHDKGLVYLCGPVEFMQEQWRALIKAGVPESRLHREVFGPELLNYLK